MRIILWNFFIQIYNSTENVLVPVMVWIHGGGFVTDSGNSESDFYGPGHILDRDVVFVTLKASITVWDLSVIENLIAIN